MFGIADLITVAVIEEGLRHFRDNPLNLQYILGTFCTPAIRDKVGAQYIKQCMDFVINNQIQVSPYYDIDLNRRPSVGVISSGREGLQFIGDYGHNETPFAQQDTTLPPIEYAKFDVLSLSKDRTILDVAEGLKLTEKLWPGLIIKNGDFTSRITGVQAGSIYIADPVPAKHPLQGWVAQSLERAKGAICSASMDDVVVNIILSTTGEPGIHRLLALVIRACLKRGRMSFDKYGMQVATFSYTPMVISEQTEMEAESTMTIEAKFTDSWIEKVFDLPDNTSNVGVGVIACPTDQDDSEVLVT